MAKKVDLNCDMGESFGPWRMGNDEAMMRYISSANVAGGFHAGDPHTMRRTVELAKEHGVAVGIHSGYRDLVGFGRREIQMSPQEVRDELIYQLGALREFARCSGMEVQHVKPHGSLYMVAARDEELSRAIIEAIRQTDPALILYCMQASVTYEVAKEMDHPVAAEFFADRGYDESGQIVFTRRVEEELDPLQVAERTLRAIRDGKVETDGGVEIDVELDTVCVHGDTPGAPELARVIVEHLNENGVEVAPLAGTRQVSS